MRTNQSTHAEYERAQWSYYLDFMQCELEAAYKFDNTAQTCNEIEAFHQCILITNAIITNYRCPSRI